MIDKRIASPGAARRIVVLGTGGTIAGRAPEPGDNLGYRAGEVGVDELLAGVEVQGVALQAEQVANIDSKDMDAAVWRALALRCAHWLAQEDLAGIVVTHGTDTLEETAFFLQRLLVPRRPVVLACAMRPATSLSSDGPQNLRDAIAVAATPGAAGVLAVCAGTIHGAQAVQKMHTYRLDAFSSGDLGPVGVVEEGRVVLAQGWPQVQPEGPAQEEAMQWIASGAPWPRVEIVLSHAGADGLLVDALLRERDQNPAAGAQGIVLAGTGNATLHRALEAAAQRARAAGVAVVRATRCPFGRVLPAGEEALPDAGGLSPVKARIALMLSLMRRSA